SIGFRDASVPLLLALRVAIAVSPNTVTLTSSYSMLSYLVAFASASIWALLLTFPSLLVLMLLSASRGATKSGLFVFCGMGASGLVRESQITCGCRRSPRSIPRYFPGLRRQRR